MTVTVDGEWTVAHWQTLGNRLLVGVVLAIELPLDLAAELARIDSVQRTPDEQAAFVEHHRVLARHDEAVRWRVELLGELAVLCRGDRASAGDPRLAALLPTIERALSVWPLPPVEDRRARLLSCDPSAVVTAMMALDSPAHSQRTMLERLVLGEARGVIEEVGAHAQRVLQHTMDPAIDARYRRLRDDCELLAERLARGAGR